MTTTFKALKFKTLAGVASALVLSGAIALSASAA